MYLRIYGIIFSAAATDGAGKTRANVIALLYAVKRLQGKKDRAGDYARIIVAGYTLAHLNKTFLVYLRQVLDQSKTRYTENKKDNFFTIGTVTVFVVPMENPDTIFGIDSWACVASGTKVPCRRFGKVREIRIKDMASGDEVFTRKGWRRVLRVISKGTQPVMRVNGLICTSDHRIWSEGWRDAEVLKRGDSVLRSSIWRIRIWEKICAKLEDAKESVSSLTELLTTGIPTQSAKVDKSILSVLRNMVRLCFCILLFGRIRTEKYQKGAWFIIKTVIRSIIRLIILKLYLLAHMFDCIIYSVCLTRWKRKNNGNGYTGLYRRGRHLCLSSIVCSAVKNLIQEWPSRGIVQTCVKSRQAGTRKLKIKRSRYADGVEMRFVRISRNMLNSVVNDAMTLINIIGEIVRPSLIVKQGSVRYAGSISLPHVVLKLLPVLRTARMLNGGRQCEVYDLTVDGNDSHEFFANGVLVHNCFCEEIDELTEDKAIEAIRALSERCRQQIPGERSPFLCFASTSQGAKGLYRIYNHFKKNGTGFVLVRGRTEDNPYLPASMIRDMKKMYSPAEKRVFMDGEFLAIAKGRVLGDFDWERNYLDYDLDRELPPGETVYIGMDFNAGYNRASAYIVREGVIYCIKAYDFPDPQDAPSVFRRDFPEQRILWIPDVTIKDSFPQFARELRKYGIQIIYRKKSPLVEDTVFLVNKLFYTGRLLVCKIAKDLAEACALFMRDKDNRVPKGVGPSSPAHYVDGARYACSFICMRHKDFRDIRELVVNKRASFRSDSDRPVQDLGSGYTRIHPDALYRGKKL